MKNCLILSIIFLTLTTKANFYEAQTLFDEKKFKLASIEYNKLAILGNVRAQYNIALMYLSGKGVQKDYIKAYAWSKTAGSSKSSTEDLTNKIKKQLTKTQLANANILAREYIANYGVKSTRKSLGPIFDQAIVKNKNNTKPYNRIVRNKKSEDKVIYPNKAVKKGPKGLVNLVYDIMPEGNVENIFILNQYPHELFSPAAIEYLQKQIFDFYLDEQKVIPQLSASAAQMVKFGVHGESGLVGRKTKMKVDELYHLAIKGDIKAQYQYSNLYYTLLNQTGLAGEKTINQWLFKNARNGMPQSQYKLGINIYFGNSCQSDSEKGLNWIIRAAQNGHAKAQYFAFQVLVQYNIKNISENSAQQWLEMAAMNDSYIAQFRIAKQLALKKTLTNTESQKALNYLNAYAENVAKTIDWYQTSALIQNKSNNNSEALKSINKAIKLAKKAHWELTKLKQQKAVIQNSD